MSKKTGQIRCFFFYGMLKFVFLSKRLQVILNVSVLPLSTSANSVLLAFAKLPYDQNLQNQFHNHNLCKIIQVVRIFFGVYQ